MSMHLQLQELCEAGGYMKMNDRFTPEINAQHAGMTPLALAAALNKVHIVGVSYRVIFLKAKYS